MIHIQKGLQVNAIIAHKNINSFDATIVSASPAILLVSVFSNHLPTYPHAHIYVPSPSLRIDRACLRLSGRPSSFAHSWMYAVQHTVQKSISGTVLPEPRCARLVSLVADEGNDHAVQVEEEHQQVETKLDEGFLDYISRLNLKAIRYSIPSYGRLTS